MNDNTLWATFWICLTLIVVAISTCMYLNSVNDNARISAEYKAAAENGLQQQYIGSKVIWVKK